MVISDLKFDAFAVRLAVPFETPAVLLPKLLLVHVPLIETLPVLCQIKPAGL